MLKKLAESRRRVARSRASGRAALELLEVMVAERRQIQRTFSELAKVVASTASTPAPPALELVTLTAFSAAADVARKTVLNALSGPLAGRQRWPEFRRTPAGWVTTPAAVSEWLERSRSSFVGSREVHGALQRVATGRRPA